MASQTTETTPPPDPPADSATQEMRQRLIDETLRRTKGRKNPHEWQLKTALNMLAEYDTLTITGTGAGKTLPFVMPAFVLTKVIIFIVAPLNYIQEQQVKDFEDMELSAVCVNQNTNWKIVKQEILRGKYQVVISSPEAFQDVDKLRGVILSQEIQDYRQFLIVDEAHTIRMWGGDFRVAYSRLGDLRAALHGVPFSAATATATEEIKNAVITSLHLGAYRPLQLTNLGNFRPNIVYSIFWMTGGANSYHEITHLFLDPTKIPKTLIFVETVEQAKYIVDELRKHFGWIGDERYRVRAYFADRAESGKEDAGEAFRSGQCDILAATQSLTMGCDFADVELVIQYTAPDSVVTLVQRMGRGARRVNIRCRAILMVTAADHERAMKLVGGGRVREQKPDDFLDPKREEDDQLGDIEVPDGVNNGEKEPENGTYKLNPNSRRFGLDIARFIMAESCYIKILDEIFDNPAHISCYDAGTCSLCAARRARDEAAQSVDIQALDRAIKREQVDHALELDEDLESGQEDEHTSVKRKTPAQNFAGDELKQRKVCLRQWRLKKFRSEALTCYITIEDIVTDQALDAIARSRQVMDLASLDNLKPQWPQRSRWGGEVLSELEDLRKKMELEKKEKAKKQAEDRARTKAAAQEAARQQEIEKMHRREAELATQRQQREAAQRAATMRPATGAYELARNTPRPAPFARQADQALRSHPPLVQATPTRSSLPAPPPLRQFPPAQQQLPLTNPENLPPGVVGRSLGRVVVNPDGQHRLVPTGPPGPATPQPRLQAGQYPHPVYPTPPAHTPRTPVSAQPYYHTPWVGHGPPTGFSPHTPQTVSNHAYQMPTPSSSSQQPNSIQPHLYTYSPMAQPPVHYYPPPMIPRPNFSQQDPQLANYAPGNGLEGTGDQE